MASKKTMQAVIAIAGKVDPSLGKAIKEATKQTSGLGKVAKVAGAAVAAAAVATVTAAVAGTKKLINLGQEYQKASNKIRIGTGATGDALKALNDDFKAVYKSVPTTMEDASQAVADYNTRLGLSGEPLQNLTEQAILVNKLLGEDLSGTVEASSKAFQQWNIDTKDMGDAMDYVFKASQSTGTGFNDLLEAAKQYGPQLQEMGFGFKESVALIGQLDKAGVESSEVLSAMKKSIGAMAKEGISASEGFDKYVDKIKNAKDMTEATAIATEIFGSRAGLTMAQAIRSGAVSVDELVSSIESSGETIRKANEDTMTFGEKLGLLKQKASVALEPLGTTFLDKLESTFPYIESGFEKAVPLIEKFGGWLQKTGNFAESAFAPAMEKLGPLFDKIKVAGDGLKPVFEFISGPLVQGAIQFLAGAVGSLIDFASSVTDVIIDITNAPADLISLWASIKENFSQLIADIQAAFASFGGGFAGTVQSVIGWVQSLRDTLTGIYDYVVGTFKAGWESAWNAVKDAFANAWNSLTGIVRAAVNGVIGIANKAIGGINKLISSAEKIPGASAITGGVRLSEIPKLANGGFTNGVSIAGEAGTEAVISFKESQRAANVSYWARAGKLLGLNGTIVDAAAGSSNSSYGGNTITFSPQITINGSADKVDIIQQLRESFSEFKDFMEEEAGIRLGVERGPVYG